jgi:hypothetical protein
VREDFGAIDSRSGLHDPQTVLGDDGGPLGGNDTNGFLLDQKRPERLTILSSCRRIDDSSLCLGHDLARNHDDVVVNQGAW